MSRDNCIHDAGSLHRYRTEIPNLVLDMLADGKIDQHDLALYVVLKRTAGDTGACWKTSTTLASETGVSAGHLVKSKAKLRDLGLIEIKATIRNGSIAHDITIADVWAENMSRFAPEPARSSGESARSSGESARSSGESARSSGERLKGEEEPFKKNQKSVVGDAPTDVPATAPGTAAAGSELEASASKPSARRTRPAPKPGNPEDRDGPYRDVFRSICKVRRLNPDMLEENEQANTRRLAGELCRKGDTPDSATVEAWGTRWYEAMAKRLGKRKADVSPPTIAQLKTHFGACIVAAQGAMETQAMDTLDPRAIFHGDDGEPRLKPAYGVASEYELYDMDPEDQRTWPDWYAAAARAFGVKGMVQA